MNAIAAALIAIVNIGIVFAATIYNIILIYNSSCTEYNYNTSNKLYNYNTYEDWIKCNYYS
jgi:hypothetical protein